MKKSVFIGSLVATAIVSSLLTYLFTQEFSPKPVAYKDKKAMKAVTTPNCPIELVRIPNSSSELIGPLLFADVTCSSPELDSLKRKVSDVINDRKKSGAIDQASVYVKSLRSGLWFEVNGTQQYEPGSMMKIAILMTYLKKSEQDPAFFKRELKLTSSFGQNTGLNQIRTSAPLELNKNYSVERLIEEMIVNSDNDATQLLIDNIDKELFSRVMGDISGRTPDISDPNYALSVMEYNRYLRVLYNTSYLNREKSLYALELLSRTNFKGGLTKALPAGVSVAHKFGERPSDNGFNFHEGGIVYLKGNPYAIVVMTKGKNSMLLPEVIADVSKICYDGLSAM